MIRRGELIVHETEEGESVRRVQHELAHPCEVCRVDRPPLRIVDLFAGEGHWSAPARDRGHTVVTTDFDPAYGSTVTADARDPDLAERLVEALGGQPDLVVGSPPCQGFTVVRMGYNWTSPHTTSKVKRYPHLASDSRPKTDKAEFSIQLVEACLRLVDELAPTWWLMENPVDKLRKLPIVGGLPRRTVTYCRYGRRFRKPTDLWGYPPPSMRFEQPCDAYNGELTEIDGEAWCLSASTGKPCHVSAPRGSVTGVQGHKRLTTTAIPYPLAWDVTTAAERDVAAGNLYHSEQEQLI